MQNKWVGIDKSGGEPKVVRKVESVQDTVLPILNALAAGQVGAVAWTSGPVEKGVSRRRLARQLLPSSHAHMQERLANCQPALLVSQSWDGSL